MTDSIGLKQGLKRIPQVRRLNALWKAWQTKLEYRATVDHYKEKLAPGSFDEMLEHHPGERLRRLRSRAGPLNVFFLGTDEFQDRAGILQALETFGNLRYFTKEDGDYGQNPRAGQPCSSERSSNSARLASLLENLAREGRVPDILLGQMWASLVDLNVLRRLQKQYGLFVVNICMDDRHAYHLHRPSGTHAMIPAIDLAATTAPESVDWYLKEGCPAVFFPEASHPGIFQLQPGLPKEHDVSFVGGCYGIRETVVQALRNAGVRVSAYGQGWELGRLPTEQVPRLFAQSKIILGVGTIGHCEDFYSLKVRDFDAPMSGSFYLTHANPDLAGLYRLGEEIETYSSVEECVRKTLYFLAREDERERIARRGYERARLDHTWEKRFRSLFELILPGHTWRKPS